MAAQEFAPYLARIQAHIQLAESRVKKVCMDNCRPDGRRSAVLDAFQYLIDFYASPTSALAKDVASANEIVAGLDQLANTLWESYAWMFQEMERHHPGFFEEVHSRWFMRKEYWKAETLKRGLFPPVMPAADKGAPAMRAQSSPLAAENGAPSRLAANINALANRTGLSNHKLADEMGRGDHKAIAEHRSGKRKLEGFTVTRKGLL